MRSTKQWCLVIIVDSQKSCIGHLKSCILHIKLWSLYPLSIGFGLDTQFFI